MLNVIGVRLSTNLLEANPGNPRGHFESHEIVFIHDHILGNLDLNWSIPGYEGGLHGAWWQRPDCIPFKRQLVEFLRPHIAGSAPFGFKDPRTARLLPLWREIFAELEIQPVYILAVRHPNAVAQSLGTRSQIDPLHAELLWLERYVDALTYTRGEIATIVHYEDWFSAPERVARRLIASLGFDWPGDALDLQDMMRDYVVPDLRRHVQVSDTFRLPLTAELYSALKSEDRARLASLAETGRTAFGLCRHAVEHAAGRLRPQIAEADERIRSLTAELESERERCAELARALDAAGRREAVPDVRLEVDGGLDSPADFATPAGE